MNTNFNNNQKDSRPFNMGAMKNLGLAQKKNT